MEKAKTRKIKKWDEVHGEHEVFDNLASSCNGEQIVDFKDIHMDKIEDVM